MKKIIIFLFLLMLSGCGPKVESIEIKNVNTNIGIEDEKAIEFTVYPEDANKSSIKWASSDEQVAVVKNGKIVGVGDGDCIITATTGNTELASFELKVHAHSWEDIKTTAHHDEEGYFKEWDETVVDEPAWDETIVDKEAWDETVLVRNAWDETVVDQEAWDEKIIDQPYIEPTLVWKYECLRCGRTYGGDVQQCRNPECKGTVVYRSWYTGGQEEVSHYVHHDAVTHVVHHDDEYETVHHDAVTHIIHHPAVTHIVHHDEIRNKEDFEKGNKDYWVVEKEAWDEEVVIGYKCRICKQTKDDEDGLKYISQFKDD